ncbi:aliphatic sulfonates import ATP-binding protein SsuB [Oxobacter pfennigii]|uniref:Aliphatic sulfonates import ATP-binding protein SsuB n=1 Tax=Oxobacter pfennigii TaxID=36849 RepID=A0A0P8W638_9CLOT|nr:ABC transporter ATP-binding protein [Oxobacter pfennigii]KPU43450.1 aliphatic sulfonates import ATP-binding protein SsuB [Oxobacter pfennigii]
MGPKIEISNLHKSFYRDGVTLDVLKDINMKVYDGEFVSVIGPSGCGKSTIFNIICNLSSGYTGNISIDGVDLKSSKKRMAYMHQKDLLMPWKNLKDNISLPLEIQGMDKKEAYEKIYEMLPVFGLEGFENAYTFELSGGMKQRAALLRTFLIDSDIMLLDEPFGALDAINRDKMQLWLLSIWEKFKRSVLFITHSIDEAIFLSDRIYVLSDRPATVKLGLSIDIERPRNKGHITSSRFNEYKALLFNTLE